jgi:hypothetical protein
MYRVLKASYLQSQDFSIVTFGSCERLEEKLPVSRLIMLKRISLYRRNMKNEAILHVYPSLNAESSGLDRNNPEQ